VRICQQRILTDWCSPMPRPSIVHLANPFELMYNSELEALSTQSLMVHQVQPASPASSMTGTRAVHCIPKS
jgi:hypothetical protein